MKSYCKVGSFPFSNTSISSSSSFYWECQPWEQQYGAGCTRNASFVYLQERIGMTELYDLEWSIVSNECSITPFAPPFHGSIFGQLACISEGLVFHSNFLVLFITASSKGSATWIQSLMFRCFRSSSMLGFHMLPQEFSSLHLCIVQLLCPS